jgi:hypothetical protein
MAGRSNPAYRKAREVVRTRATNGEGCYFCGEPIIMGLPRNHRRAFTCHETHMQMHPGHKTYDPATMYPAHRGCNASHGLRMQNQRRRQQVQPHPHPHHQHSTNTEPHSRSW